MGKTVNVQIVDAKNAFPGHLPMQIRATVTPKDPSLPACDLLIDRSHPHRDQSKPNPPQLREMLLSARLPGCPELTSTNIRVPIGQYFDEVIAAAIDEFEVTEKPPTPWDGARGRRITTQQLERVADIYRRAIAEHKPPLREIERSLTVSRSTAGRLVMQARAAGVLGPPPRLGVAGEARIPKRRGKS